ncbi:hypothetical protein JCM19231_1295 [Vibrio ishigakensis]|uniref:Uncharacterized protein n=1 Tax=Vibrio ishigakensis TaxID=1481914 RepID=A0A0B8NSX3_9VIBR|nr:hypothetical protein JCM19231_1295 [Vibrio ishigakensis]
MFSFNDVSIVQIESQQVIAGSLKNLNYFVNFNACSVDFALVQ